MLLVIRLLFLSSLCARGLQQECQKVFTTVDGVRVQGMPGKAGPLGTIDYGKVRAIVVDEQESALKELGSEMKLIQQGLAEMKKADVSRRSEIATINTRINEMSKKLDTLSSLVKNSKSHCTAKGCPLCRTREDQLSKTVCLPGIAEECEICDKASICFDLLSASCSGEYVYQINVVKVLDDLDIFVEFEGLIETVYKGGSDGARSGEKKTFKIRSDCYRDCIDLDSSTQTQKIVEEGRTLLVIGKRIHLSQVGKGEIWSQYQLSSGAVLQRITPTDKCKASRAKTESKKCRTVSASHSQKTAESCKKSKAMDQECKNLLHLRRTLIMGCDRR